MGGGGWYYVPKVGIIFDEMTIKFYCDSEKSIPEQPTLLKELQSAIWIILTVVSPILFYVFEFSPLHLN